MKKDATKKDAMTKDATKKGATKNDAMKKDATKKGATKKDATHRKCNVQECSLWIARGTYVCRMPFLNHYKTEVTLTLGSPPAITASRQSSSTRLSPSAVFKLISQTRGNPGLGT